MPIVAPLAETRIRALIQQPKTHEWHTPQEFFDNLNSEFGFTLDAASTDSNALCDHHFTASENGLVQAWHPHIVWCNPPYGNEIGEWVAKAHRESRLGATVVLLIPSRTDTAWWHKHVMKSAEIRLVRGRLRFSGAATVAPFPNAVIVFRPNVNTPILSAIGRDGRP